MPQCTANVADGSKPEYLTNARMSASTGADIGGKAPPTMGSVKQAAARLVGSGPGEPDVVWARTVAPAAQLAAPGA